MGYPHLADLWCHSLVALAGPPDAATSALEPLRLRSQWRTILFVESVFVVIGADDQPCFSRLLIALMIVFLLQKGNCCSHSA